MNSLTQKVLKSSSLLVIIIVNSIYMMLLLPDLLFAILLPLLCSNGCGESPQWVSAESRLVYDYPIVLAATLLGEAGLFVALKNKIPALIVCLSPVIFIAYYAWLMLAKPNLTQFIHDIAGFL